MIAREYLTGSLSMSELARKHGLKSASVVQTMVEWFRKNEASTSSSVQASTANSEVEEQLKDAQLRITALEMLIKNAEKELGVDIVKKLGIKQPPK